MNETAVFPWIPVTTIAVGLVAYAVVTRVVPAVVRIALRELEYRAGDHSTWPSRHR